MRRKSYEGIKTALSTRKRIGFKRRKEKETKKRGRKKQLNRDKLGNVSRCFKGALGKKLYEG